MGVIGLALLAAFVAMAALAPWLYPAGATATAPAEDILEAHNLRHALPPGNWSAPSPVIDGTGKLVALRLLDPGERVALLPVRDGVLELALDEPRLLGLPPGTGRFDHVPHALPFFLSSNETALVRWSATLEPLDAPTAFGFPAAHAGDARVFGKLYAAPFAGGSEVGLLAGREALGATFGETRAPVWWTRAEIPNATATGPPVVLLLDERTANATAAGRGNLVAVPTTRGVVAFHVEVARAGSRVTDIRLGAVAWEANLTSPPVKGLPAVFPTSTSDAFGKDRLIGAAEDGTFFALDRDDGSLLWQVRPILPKALDAEPVGVSSSPRGLVLATFRTSAGGGAVAALLPATGAVAGNHTWYLVAPGQDPLASPIAYVDALKQYVFSTESGNVYLVEEDLSVAASFSVTGGTETPIAYVGNIFSNIGAPQKGNYFAAITGDGQLFAQSTGNLRTPLAPSCNVLGVQIGEPMPSGRCYLLGTDAYGHDILGWLIWGTRAELYVGVTSALVAVIIGTIVGLVAGYVGGIVDDLLMRITDINLTLPALVIALLVVAMFGPSLFNVILIIAFLSWSVTARVIRSQTLSLKERPFVNAARMSGASPARIIFRHLAPNVLPLAFLFMTLGVSGAIIVEALLSFLGFGDPSAITWGMMLQFLYISGHTLTAPWWLVPPGVAITLLSLSFYLVGRALDDIVNPRLRAR